MGQSRLRRSDPARTSQFDPGRTSGRMLSPHFTMSPVSATGPSAVGNGRSWRGVVAAISIASSPARLVCFNELEGRRVHDLRREPQRNLSRDRCSDQLGMRQACGGPKYSGASAVNSATAIPEPLQLGRAAASTRRASMRSSLDLDGPEACPGEDVPLIE